MLVFDCSDTSACSDRKRPFPHSKLTPWYSRSVPFRSSVVLLQYLLFLLVLLHQQIVTSCHGYSQQHRQQLQRQRQQQYASIATARFISSTSPIVHRRILIQSTLNDDNDNDDGDTSFLTQQQNNSSIKQSNNNSNENNDSTSSLSKAYQIAQYGYYTAGILLFLVPDRTATVAATTTVTTISLLTATKWGAAAGFIMAGRLCYILYKANVQQRLSSDTYKRINIGLFGFNLIGLAAIPGEAGFVRSIGGTTGTYLAVGLLTMLRLYGAVVTFNGWIQYISDMNGSTGAATNASTGTNVVDAIVPRSRSRSRSRIILLELGQGIKDTIGGLQVRSAKKALTYRNCLLILCFGMLSRFMETLFSLRYQKEFMCTWFGITLQWSVISRLFMIATIVYSLKDAAERDRLTGTTFIELNLMVGLWSFLVGLGQAIVPVGFAAYRGVEMVAFSLPFLLRAYKSQKEKMSVYKLAVSVKRS
jgi:hypothetical protein